MPPIASAYGDGVFRFLRHRLGLDGALSMLLTAESIACIDDRGLHDASASLLLRDICAQILRDDVQHVRFHRRRIALLRASAPPPLASLRHAWRIVTQMIDGSDDAIRPGSHAFDRRRPSPVTIHPNAPRSRLEGAAFTVVLT